MKVLIGTNNLHKLEEFKTIFLQANLPLEVCSLKEFPSTLEEPVENGHTFKENSLIKAKFYYEKYKMPVLADDSGLCVEALNGEPGIYSARYASSGNVNTSSADNRNKLLMKLKNVKNRKAYFVCAIAYYDGKNTILVEEKLDGVIAEHEVGNNGFGYDSIFILPSLNKTMAELDESQKNTISHRYKAISSFISEFKKLD